MNHLRKSQLGQRFTSDFIDYDRAILKGNQLLWSEKQSIIGFYILFSCNTGLRISDVLARKHSELMNCKPGDYLRLTEHKTGKYREIQINSKVVEAYQYLVSKLGSVDPDDYIFKSQKGTVYHIESLNCILKETFAGCAPHISTHSLRKSFGRRIYELNGKSEDCLIKLSELFQHSNMAITRRYLGLRREEIGSLYMNL
jgi:integrase